jgi:hypothetical protein
MLGTDPIGLILTGGGLVIGIMCLSSAQGMDICYRLSDLRSLAQVQILQWAWHSSGEF